MDVKTKACEVLLQHRVEAKYRSKKVDSILNRLHVAEPVARDNKARTAFIPEAAIRKQQEKLAKKNDVDMDDDDYGEDEDEEENVKKPARRKTERELELEQADEYFLDLQKNYDLPEDQKYDVIPETWNGHNIADFIDPEIMEKLDALEKEEEAREAGGYYDSEEREFEDLGVDMKDKDDSHFNRSRS